MILQTGKSSDTFWSGVLLKNAQISQFIQSATELTFGVHDGNTPKSIAAVSGVTFWVKWTQLSGGSNIDLAVFGLEALGSISPSDAIVI